MIACITYYFICLQPPSHTHTSYEWILRFLVCSAPKPYHRYKSKMIQCYYVIDIFLCNLTLRHLFCLIYIGRSITAGWVRYKQCENPPTFSMTFPKEVNFLFGGASDIKHCDRYCSYYTKRVTQHSHCSL